MCPPLKQAGVSHQFHDAERLENLVIEEGDVVGVLGNNALSHVQASGLLPKGRKAGSMRQREHLVDGVPFLVSPDPYLATLDHSAHVSLVLDLRLMIRRCTTGTCDPEIGSYRWVDDFTDIVNYVEVAEGQTIITVDLETLGLDEFAPEAFIVSIAISCSEGMSDVIRFKPNKPPTKKVLDQVRLLLTHPRVKTRGANFKYDQRWMAHHWDIHCTNFSMDTTLVGSLLDENRSNSLNVHAKLYTTMGGYDDPLEQKYDKGRMDLIPDKDLLPYAGGDTDATLRVSNRMVQEIAQDGRLARFYNELLHPSAQCFQRMETSGILIDVPYYQQLREEVAAEIADLQAKAEALMPQRLKNKHKGDLSLTRAAVIQDFMFSPRGLNLKPYMLTEKSGAPSTAKNHLQMFVDHPDAADFIELLNGFNGATKTLSTYIDGFLAVVRSDGRLHPSYMLHRGEYGGKDSGTVTGRLSAKDPAVQTIPKHSKWAKALRKGYIAPPGYQFFEVDFSQGELRVTACVANEPTMIKAYNEGIDMHLLTGCDLTGTDLEWAAKIKAMGKDAPKEHADLVKMIRQNGKAGNFGLIYGMSAGGFQIYARDSYGVLMALDEAEQKRNAFFARFDRLPHWHTVCKQVASRHFQIRSPLGRIRHLPNINSKDSSIRSQAERQSINSPVQATLSDLTQYAMVQFCRRYPDVAWTDLIFAMMTHDSLGGYVRDDKADILLPLLVEVMSNLPLESVFGWKPQVQFTADAELGPNLGALQEYEIAA